MTTERHEVYIETLLICIMCKLTQPAIVPEAWVSTAEKGVICGKCLASKKEQKRKGITND